MISLHIHEIFDCRVTGGTNRNYLLGEAVESGSPIPAVVGTETKITGSEPFPRNHVWKAQHLFMPIFRTISRFKPATLKSGK